MSTFVEAWRNGQVVRKHTMENIRAENIAEHTWGVVMLLMVAWPNVPMRIVKCAQIHDCGERATGDMPGHIKWSDPVLEEHMNNLEHKHMVETLPNHLCEEFKLMTEADWAVIEVFDRAEFCVSMIRERKLGNQYTEIYYKRSWDKLTQTIQKWREDFKAMDPELWNGISIMYREIPQSWALLKPYKLPSRLRSEDMRL